MFAHLNANKRTLELDLQLPEHRDRLRTLVAGADILIESHTPGWLAGLELDYPRLREINPALIMASVTGFGQWGPHSRFAYNDLVVFAMCGLMSISGDPDGPPCAPPETQAYYFGSLMAALGIVAALHRRERTGAGDWIDVSMQEALATQEHMIRLYANEKEIHIRAGSQHQHVAPARIFPCRDGYVYLYVSRQHWKKFLEIWTDHPKEFDAPGIPQQPLPARPGRRHQSGRQRVHPASLGGRTDPPSAVQSYPVPAGEPPAGFPAGPARGRTALRAGGGLPGRDLVDPARPSLPVEWIETPCDVSAASSSGCGGCLVLDEKTRPGRGERECGRGRRCHAYRR